MDSPYRGFAIVDALNPKTVNILHVSIIVASQEPLKYEISLSGIWELTSKDVGQIESLLFGRIPVGTKDGIAFIKRSVGIDIQSNPLLNFVTSSQAEQDRLQVIWQKHKDDEPKKRKNLVTPKWPQWPTNIEDAVPMEILTGLGKLPYSAETPKEMRTLIAFGRLVYLMLENWMTIEEERTRRPFLKLDEKFARQWPPTFHTHLTN